MTTGLENAYTRRPIEERAEQPLYKSVRELIARQAIKGDILDLGCSDGVATFGLEGHRVTGIDSNPGSIALAVERNPGYRAVLGDIRQLPVAPEEFAQTRTVLALDVLEHMTWRDSVGVLQALRGLMPHEHSLIASLPVISPISIETWREALHMIKNGQRPESGLFDATHIILKGQRAHRRLLAGGGYEVAEEYQTNHVVGVTGEWDWRLDDVEERQRADRGRVKNAIVRQAISAYNLFDKSKSDQVRRLGRGLFAYQGIYVARPAERS